jgi:hypothetical protein
VARLPHSEAGVERVFSHLGSIIGNHRRSIQDDLSKALLVIKLHDIPNAAGLSCILDRVHSDPAGDHPSQWTGDEHHRAPPPPPGEDCSAQASQPQPRPTELGENALALRVGAQLARVARSG